MIKILTDSTADFTAEQIKKYDLQVVPLTVNFGDEQYEDGKDLPLEEFYDRLAQSTKLPTTSQPSPNKFLPCFLAAKQAGDDVICILLSSDISGTCQSARIAKEECEYDRVFVIDSRNATLGLQLLVRRAIEFRDENMAAVDIVLKLENIKSRICLFAVVDDLKYLRKGGRLSGAAAFAGGLLGIKPVVEVANGKVGLAGKARGLPGAYLTIFNLIQERGGIDSDFQVMIGYTGHRHGIEPFARYCTQNLHLQKPLVGAIGTVIGTHAGPGACGIAFFAKDEQSNI